MLYKIPVKVIVIYLANTVEIMHHVEYEKMKRYFTHSFISSVIICMNE